jgi:hypothetical protein
MPKTMRGRAGDQGGFQGPGALDMQRRSEKGLALLPMGHGGPPVSVNQTLKVGPWSYGITALPSGREHC